MVIALHFAQIKHPLGELELLCPKDFAACASFLA
jgi:hypothetical protein